MQTLVTTALPYANGQLHLGHLLEAIQADIFVRFLRQSGQPTLFLAGDDAHGTAIMISAEKQGISPETLIDNVQKSHVADFKNFLISFDHYHTTHSPENRELSALIYTRLQERGDISTRTITQAYDPVAELFLPDRYIRGTCPKCKTPDQYGDNCEVCGTTYSPTDLIDPVSAISGAKPVPRESEHYFFHLEHYTEFLQHYIQTAERLQPEVANKLQEWFHEGLKPWDISRDAPYFGFEIPDAPGKYFYVWLDAPVGYLACLAHFAKTHPDYSLEQYWAPESQTAIHHFIGKDIVYFHALFWPAMLQGAQFRTPSALHVHGYLTINGQKMSKSRGTFITAEHFAEHINPETLRYYFATKLSNHVEDIDLNLSDFMLRVNSDLVGKYVNLASRSAGFITKHFNGQLAPLLHDPALFAEAQAIRDTLETLYKTHEYGKAMREIMGLADRANQYIDHEKPWARIKTEGATETVQAICTQGLNLFRLLTLYLKPVLPETAGRVETFLQIPPLTWQDAEHPLLAHAIAPFTPLLTRITPEAIEALCPPPA
ncbi:MAG: methionine--tRNA ligase [Gammaproteobacteria bacterium RIFCSPHIGHO2_12_FULL_45_9]|nr:MAG: methionine--tRNA ligase [Gammaproteobacteria bacterium RIFCSPHIGHO2_12_FULL_45_9]